MKKEHTAFALTLSGITLALLAALTVYLAVSDPDTLRPEAKNAESSADAALLMLREPAKAAPGTQKTTQEPLPVSETLPDRFLIWAGDSRTLGMRDAMKNDSLYIGAAGEGYRWLASEGLPSIKEAISEYPDVPVIFNFGVNDYDSMNDYLSLYQKLVHDYPDATFYFLAVNPIDPEVCRNITNAEILDFNQHLQNAFPDTYIDSYNWMRAQEIVPFDGIHYSKEDYQRLYQFVLDRLP